MALLEYSLPTDDEHPGPSTTLPALPVTRGHRPTKTRRKQSANAAAAAKYRAKKKARNDNIVACLEGRIKALTAENSALRIENAAVKMDLNSARAHLADAKATISALELKAIDSLCPI